MFQNVGREHREDNAPGLSQRLFVCIGNAAFVRKPNQLGPTWCSVSAVQRTHSELFCPLPTDL